MNEFNILHQLAIVHQEEIKEIWRCVGVFAAFAMVVMFICGTIAKYAPKISAFFALCKKHPFQTTFLSLLATPLIIYGATKIPILIPQEQQCDYRIGEEVDVTDGWVNYALMTGDIMPTNIMVACCNGAVTNTMEFTHSGQFYIETIQYPANTRTRREDQSNSASPTPL